MHCPCFRSFVCCVCRVSSFSWCLLFLLAFCIAWISLESLVFQACSHGCMKSGMEKQHLSTCVLSFFLSFSVSVSTFLCPFLFLNRLSAAPLPCECLECQGMRRPCWMSARFEKHLGCRVVLWKADERVSDVSLAPLPAPSEQRRPGGILSSFFFGCSIHY